MRYAFAYASRRTGTLRTRAEVASISTGRPAMGKGDESVVWECFWQGTRIFGKGLELRCSASRDSQEKSHSIPHRGQHDLLLSRSLTGC